MSKEVENRVVSITFENSSFEKKLSETITSLDKLRASLDFSKSKDSLAAVGDATSKFNLGNVTSQIEHVSKGFIAMSTIAITALSNITSKALEAGINFAKSFTVAPILDGFSEYETKIGAIQTILSNTSAQGTTLQEVTHYLDDLNAYADKTIYSFGEMTKNVGLFTNAGIGIKDATSMIKGFSNEAAASGTNAEGAASAAYQLSQALSAGTIRLMDWRSLQNVGMGNANMKKGLLEIAEAMGQINTEELNKAQKDFNGSLETGWLSADVMSTYLRIMAGDMDKAAIEALGLSEATADAFLKQQKMSQDAAQKVRTLSQLMGTIKESVGSGWSETFNLLFGDFNEATELFTAANDSISGAATKMTEARNSLIEGWKAFGGRAMFIDALGDAIRGLGTILTPIRKAFRDIFPPTTVATLLIMTKKFHEFTQTIAVSEETASKIRTAFGGLFAGFRIGLEVVKNIVGLFWGLSDSIAPSNGSVLNLAESFGEFMLKLNESLVAGGKIKEFFQDLGRKAQEPIKFIKELKDDIFGLFSSVELPGIAAIGSALGGLADKFDGVKESSSKVGDVFKSIGQRMQDLWEELTDIGNKIKNWFKDLGNSIADMLKPDDFDRAVDALNVGLLGGILFAIRKFTKEGFKIDATGGFMKSVTDALGELTDTLHAMTQSVKADTILKIAIALAILSASVTILSLIPSDKLATSLGALGGGLAAMIGSLKALTLISAGPKGAAKLTLMSTALIALAGAVVILSLAVQILARLSPEELATGLAGIATMLAALSAAAIPLSKNSGGLVTAGVGILAISGALVVLTGAVKLMSMLSWDEIVRGLTGLGLGLAIMVAAISLMPEGVAASATELVFLAGAMYILGQAMSVMAALSWEELGKGLAGVAGALILMVGALHLMPKDLGASSFQLVLLASSMLLIGQAMQSFGSMSLEEIGKSLLALAGTLGILVITLNTMTSALLGAASLVIVTAALFGLAMVMKIFAAMSIAEIAMGLGMIALTMTVLAVAALLLAPATVALLGFGAALLAVGAGFALFGAGIYLLAEGFGMLASSFAGGSKALVKGMGILLSAIPNIVTKLVEALKGLLYAVLQIVPDLLKILGAILVGLADLVIKFAPKLGEALLTLIIEACKLLVKAVPILVEAGVKIIIALLTGIKENIGKITDLVIDVMVAFVKAITDRLPDIISAGTQLIVAFINGIASNIGMVIEAGVNLLVKLLEGIAKAIPIIAGAVTNIITAFLKAFGDSVDDIVTAGANMIIKIMEGIATKIRDIITAGKNIAIAFLDGMVDNAIDFVNKAAKVLIKFLDGMAEAVRKNGPEIRRAAGNLARALMDEVVEWIKGAGGMLKNAVTGLFGGVVSSVGSFFGIGGGKKDDNGKVRNLGIKMTQTLAVGIGYGGQQAIDAAEQLGTDVFNAMRSTMSALPKAMEAIDDINPTITPVLDLSQVQKDSKAINAYLGATPLAVSTSLAQANIISKDTAAAQQPDETPEAQPQYVDIKFEQNNYSPKALSTSDIYRGTRSQIALAKEELKVP